MPSLPTGTVTFLFTDIEGSTRLLKQFGNHYADVLVIHRRFLRTAIQKGPKVQSWTPQGMPCSCLERKFGADYLRYKE